MLEQRVPDRVLDRVPRYYYKEHEIKENVGGIPFFAVLDSFRKSTGSILEYKTSKNPWTPRMVFEHLQLDIYSLMVKLKYGYVDPVVKLVWIETEYAPEYQQVGSRTLLGESDTLRYTGRIEILERKIYEWERVKIKKDIIKVAKEIAEDYKQYGHKYKTIV